MCVRVRDRVQSLGDGCTAAHEDSGAVPTRLLLRESCGDRDARENARGRFEGRCVAGMGEQLEWLDMEFGKDMITLMVNLKYKIANCFRNINHDLYEKSKNMSLQY